MEEDVNAGLSDDPVAVVGAFPLVEFKQSGKELLVDQLSDDGKVLDGLLLHFQVEILPQRQHLQPYELLTQALPEALAHAAKQLHCHYAVLLHVIVVCHFNHVL